MISAGLEGRIPYMTYPEPWRGPPKQPPEFLRPAPKPIPPSSTSRYNGVSSSSPNGTRLIPSQRVIPKYTSPSSIPTPVNLTQHKDEVAEDLPYNAYRPYAPPHFPHFPPFTMYQTPYGHMMRPNFLTTPLPTLETYSSTTPTSITASSTFLSPPATFSPPSTAIKPGQSILRDKRTPPQPSIQQTQIQSSNSCQQQQQQVSFKVPSGKEGSLKHRILTRPEDATRANAGPLDLQKNTTISSSDAARRRLSASTMSPPRSPKKPFNNNSVPGNFAKGSLIQLANGELKTIEDMRTEDFVTSADHCPELRLAESTVVKIEDNRVGTATITLSYNQRRTQVEVEAALEHPFFVFGQGWASCSPDKTLLCYRLKVHRLQVGDILISLTPREQFVSQLSSLSSSSSSSSTTTNNNNCNRTTTILTTSTSTAMTPLPTLRNNDQIHKHHQHHQHHHNQQVHPINLHTTPHNQHQQQQPMSPDSLAARKRRWSAPDQICDEEEQARIIRQRVD